MGIATASTWAPEREPSNAALVHAHRAICCLCCCLMHAACMTRCPPACDLQLERGRERVHGELKSGFANRQFERHCSLLLSAPASQEFESLMGQTQRVHTFKTMMLSFVQRAKQGRFVAGKVLRLQVHNSSFKWKHWPVQSCPGVLSWSRREPSFEKQERMTNSACTVPSYVPGFPCI